jgi:hypothetical protein
MLKDYSMRKSILVLLLMYFSFAMLSACGKAEDPAAKAVVDYLTALVNKDPNAISALSCADWESNAQLELDSLQAVSTKLEGLSCTVTAVEGSTSKVVCQGKILATYNNEDQQFDLSVRTYQVLHQGGDYLICGYQ